MAFPAARAGLGPIIGIARGVIGMVHLAPLPGSPRWAGSIDEVTRAALSDARALADGGADALLIENFHDAPFTGGRVDAATVAAMAAVARRIADAVPLPLGINVLRSDGRSALAVAVAAGARFIRVNVHVGATLTDQGVIQGDAHALLRERRMLGVAVRILADVRTKHGAPLADIPLEQEARDCVERGLADGLIVSGAATGEPTAPGDLKRVRDAVPEIPLLVGSGATPASARELLAVADGLIVGTAVKRDGVVGNPVDAERVRRLVAAVRSAV
jgi:membrane complex biogenesis BtpA family protein